MGWFNSTAAELIQHDDSNFTKNATKPEVISESYLYVTLLVVILIVMAVGLLSTVSNQCASTWRWIKLNLAEGDSDTMGSSPGIANQSTQISRSLPELQPLSRQDDGGKDKDSNKPRPGTTPAVPPRHQIFQRKLSLGLDKPQIQFSICKFEERPESLGTLKPELYKKEKERSDSTDSSVELEYNGKLHLSLRYDHELEGLVVKVFQAQDLTMREVSGTGTDDAYVRVCLLPDRTKRFQTKIQQENSSPVFNETFVFSVAYEELNRRHLLFSVYYFDHFRKDDMIGQVVMKGLLESTDLRREIQYTMNIICTKRDKKQAKEVMVSLCYLPRAGRLTVTIIKGRHLKLGEKANTTRPFVKVQLLCGGKKVKRKKTSVKRGSPFPLFNEALVFDVPLENMRDSALLIKVFNYDFFGRNKLIGCAGIGICFMGPGRDHWLEIVNNPRRPFAQWYVLTNAIPGFVPLRSRRFPSSLLPSCLFKKKMPTSSDLEEPTELEDED